MTSPDYATASPRPKLFVIAAIGGVLLAVLALVVFVLLPGDADSTTTTPTATPAASTPPAPGSPAPSAAPTGQSPVPTAAPAGVAWQLVGQVAVPVSSTDGPSRSDADHASGFAHTPVGALIAAAQISTRAGYSAGAKSWEAALQNQFVASADRDRLLSLLRDAKAQGQQPASAGSLSQVSGFRYISYTAEVATIGLVRRSPSGAHAITTLTLRWDGGDWKVVAPPAGHWPAVTTPLTDMTGVVAWGAS
ncbi:hypothetical protein [Catellatospora sp. NPDC049133]|uniref:hypothetical protein n=1 Tax=Catellatospora sp. NPDC049133 TaxID=3155499 RepID=UPI0033D36D53